MDLVKKSSWRVPRLFERVFNPWPSEQKEFCSSLQNCDIDQRNLSGVFTSPKITAFHFARVLTNLLTKDNRFSRISMQNTNESFGFLLQPWKADFLVFIWRLFPAKGQHHTKLRMHRLVVKAACDFHVTVCAPGQVRRFLFCFVCFFDVHASMYSCALLLSLWKTPRPSTKTTQPAPATEVILCGGLRTWQSDENLRVTSNIKSTPQNHWMSDLRWRQDFISWTSPELFCLKIDTHAFESLYFSDFFFVIGENCHMNKGSKNVFFGKNRFCTFLVNTSRNKFGDSEQRSR